MSDYTINIGGISILLNKLELRPNYMSNILYWYNTKTLDEYCYIYMGDIRNKIKINEKGRTYISDIIDKCL